MPDLAPTEVQRFVALTEHMRRCQNAYFRDRSRDKLEEAKRAEKAVDDWIAFYRNPQQTVF